MPSPLGQVFSSFDYTTTVHGRHGPSKEPSKQGLTDELSGLSLEDDDYKSGASTSSQSQNFNPDPSGNLQAPFSVFNAFDFLARRRAI